MSLNKTSYNYINSLGLKNAHISSSTGIDREIGILKSLEDCGCNFNKLSYSISFSLKEFNAISTTYPVIDWKTQYLAINLSGYYSFFPYENHDLLLKFGSSYSTLIKGNQYIAPYNYDLSNYNEFKGNWINPFIGLQFKEKGEFIHAFVGYNVIKSINLSNTGPEYLSFLTGELNFGIIIPLEKNKYYH